MSAVFDNWGLFGNNGGSVVIGRNQSGSILGNGVEVGSRLGQTAVVADNLSLLAGNGTTSSTHAQLGYRGDNGDGNLLTGLDDARGDIRVQLKGDLTMQGGQEAVRMPPTGNIPTRKSGTAGIFKGRRTRR